MLVPLYQSETAPKRIRGALVTCYQLFITIGILLAAIVEYFTKNYSDSSAYQIPIGIQLIFGGLLGIGSLFIPESPRFLIKQGKPEQAARSLAIIRGASVDSAEVQEEIAEIKANYEFELSLGTSTYADCFKGSNLVSENESHHVHLRKKYCDPLLIRRIFTSETYLDRYLHPDVPAAYWC